MAAGLSGPYHLWWFYLGIELPASVFKYDTLCTRRPRPRPQTVSNYFWTQTLPQDKKGSSKCVGRFTVSLWSAFHFSGCDELLCSHFNSQHHIIGHHLGLSFLLSSSISLSSVPLWLRSPHVLHMHVHGRKSYICCQSLTLPWNIM